MLLYQYKFEIQYRPGNENANADSLWRKPDEVLASQLVAEGFEDDLRALGVTINFPFIPLSHF